MQFAVRSNDDVLHKGASILSHYGFTQDGGDELHDIPYFKDAKGTHCEIEVFYYYEPNIMQLQFISPAFYKEIQAANDLLDWYWNSR